MCVCYFLPFYRRKRSLRRLCFYTCLSVILFTGGVCSGGSAPGRSPGPHLGGLLLRGVSRPTPGGESPGSHLGGLQAHTWGVSRPTPGGFLGPHPGGVIPACTEADPQSRRQLLRAVRIPLECILVSENSLDKTLTPVFAVELCVHLLVARVFLCVGICTGF